MLASASRDPLARVAPLCVAVVAAAFAYASWCRFGWTWDGGFLFFCTLHDHAPAVSHGRLTNLPLMRALLLAQSLGWSIDDLAFAHGLLYSVIPVVALATTLAILRGPHARLRPWAVIGVLFVPLPGQMCPTMDTTPALQLVWPLIAFAWAGYPQRWLPIVGLFAVALFFQHPLSAVLFAMVAAVAATRRRGPSSAMDPVYAWLFGVLAAARLWLVATTISDYEQSQFALDRVWIEMWSVLLLAPVALVVIIAVWCSCLRTRSTRWMWLTVLFFGLWFFHDARWWSGALNYRKFGVLLLAPFVVAGTRAARDPRARAVEHPLDTVVLPCVVFATLLGIGAWSWARELDRLQRFGAGSGARVVEIAEVPGLVGTPLNHWSGAVTSMMLQGSRPRWLLRSHGVDIGADEVRLWPGHSGISLVTDSADGFDLRGVRRSATP